MFLFLVAFSANMIIMIICHWLCGYFAGSSDGGAGGDGGDGGGDASDMANNISMFRWRENYVCMFAGLRLLALSSSHDVD